MKDRFKKWIADSRNILRLYISLKVLIYAGIYISMLKILWG